jgi:hypothetical protein
VLIQGVRAESQQERKRCLVVVAEAGEVELGNQRLVAEVAGEVEVERAV